ncbi:hypothetical protein D9611_006023 [Ephemerocybe angulata]|uniref:RRM domain-containing protein n=1 Tax=Ephemerocybe angulata TaxID=980116 RepID=A0A8H5FLL6_9AGAR|nr:hypothetical protein D9611_006023 [Tulosesus angulatus]
MGRDPVASRDGPPTGMMSRRQAKQPNAPAKQTNSPRISTDSIPPPSYLAMADPTSSKPQDPKAPVTKRLHIGGLTPSITLADLNKRLATFGTIEGDISGLGKVDAVGRTKNFVHVTLNTNVGQLAKCECSCTFVWVGVEMEKDVLGGGDGGMEGGLMAILGMNVLSGSTWKGAKLKLSEAKPDYTERLEAERAENARLSAEPPRKKQRRNVGVAAPDMSLVTPLAASKKAGWKVTEMGRVLRPVRMRPEHPLPPTLEELAKAKAENAKAKGKGATVKGAGFKKGKSNEEKKEERRRRKRDPLVRARRVTIDVTKWESTQLKGMFLESQGAGIGKKTLREDIQEEEVDEEDDTSSEEEEGESSEEVEEEVQEEVKPVPKPKKAVTPPPPAAPPRAPSPPAQNPTFAIPTTTDIPDNNTNLTLEKSRALNLLSSLFPNANADDEDAWIGRESAGSDVDEEELFREERKAAGHAKGRAGDVEFEVVPRDEGKKVEEKKKVSEVEVEEEEEEEGEESDEESDEEMDEEMDVDAEAEGKEAEKEKEAAPAPVVQAAPNLKDLFAPREEEAGFSLLGHLDLDLDLDEELAFAIAPPPESTPQPSFPTSTTLPAPSTTLPAPSSAPAAASIYINPREPLFFAASHPPHSKPSPHPSTLFFTTNPHKKAKDTFDLMAEKGWYWRDEAVRFYRTEGEEEVRKAWEERKGELTRGWKRRAREAGKSGRRRGRVEGEV